MYGAFAYITSKDRVNGFVAACSKDGGPQNFVCLRIHDDLHETLRLALFNCAAHFRHGQAADQRAATALADFCFGQASATERRIDVQGISGNAIADSTRIIIQKVRGDNFRSR